MPTPTRLGARSSRADLGLLAVVAIWGLNFPLVKVPLEVMHPFTVNLLRFSISTLTLGAVWAAEARRQREGFFSPLRGQAGTVVGLALLGNVLYQVLFILGMVRTTAGSAALLIASSPVWTSVFSHVAGHDRLRGWQVAGLAIGGLGVAVVILGGNQEVDLSAATVLGDVMILGAALSWSIYNVLSRPLLARGTNPVGLTFFTVATATPALFALGVPGLGAGLGRAGLAEWGALAFSGGLSTGIAYVLWNQGIRRVGASQTAAFSNLVPFVALVASWLLLGEPLLGPQLLGGVLIVGGLVVMRRG